ncbi:MAG: ABC transporter permease [Defluviitaleaceae bacterium]|nr:ABC transporter permease [Defluviitaleaceae bacterium]
MENDKVLSPELGTPDEKKLLRAEKRKVSFINILWKEIWADKLAFVALVIFVGIVLTAFIWSMFIDTDEAVRVNLRTQNQAPSAEFTLGTDNMGRDVIDMLVLGSRNSLSIAFIVTGMVAIVGVLVGVFTGFYGGRADNLIMRAVDTLSMLPFLMLVIAVITAFGWTMFLFIFLMSSLGWIGICRIIRTRALQQGRLDYVSASKTLGTPNVVIIFREVIPNLVAVLSTILTLTLANNIGLEIGLTFLGFGLPPGTPSLGTLLALASVPVVMEHRMWQWLPPALIILTLALCVNFVSQAVNRAADARQRLV